MSTVSSVVPSLSETLAKYSCLKLQSNNKILCTATGHEMSARADVVHAYITGTKFKKATEWYQYDFSQFLPYIVADKSNENKYLRCTLTDKRLNRIPDEIKRHMSGKRFQRLRKEHEELTEKRKRKLQEKADREALWVPPDEDLEEDEDDEDNVVVEKRKSKKSNKKSRDDVKADEEDEDEDNLSDLMGSDVESIPSSSDVDVDDDDDEEEEEEIVVKPHKPVKKSLPVKSDTTPGKKQHSTAVSGDKSQTSKIVSKQQKPQNNKKQRRN